MDTRRLVDMRCPLPTCAESLQVAPQVVPPRFAPPPHAFELIEGFVRCEKCRREYPVVAGVLLLPDDVKTYVCSHYSLLLTCAAAEGVLGPEMLQYLRSHGYEFIHLNRRDYSYAHHALYICAHYDDMAQAAASMGGPFVEYLQQYNNLYDVLFHKVKERLGKDHVALDVGCNVGGMVYRLAPHCAFVYGVDLSFAATLIARRLLLHQPVAQKSYRLPKEGRQSEERGLSLKRPDNIEMVVASGTHLPFPPGMFDFVSCLSVIDNVPDPAALIGSISSSLKPGGIFLFSSPYSWIVDFTNVNKWLGEETGQPPAAALKSLLTEHFEVLWEQEAIPWILRDDQRCYEVWLNHCVIAQKN